MTNEALKEVLNELFSHLEKLETQSEAILQFLKEKKRVTDKQLAPYLEQAGNASNVRWRAARVRIEHMLAPEHPEEEVKLGKTPELHEEVNVNKKAESQKADSSDAKSVDEQQVEARNKDVKQSKSDEPPKPDDQTNAGPAVVVQSAATDGKGEKPADKSEVEPKSAEPPTQDQREQKSDSFHHPTEVTEPLAQKEGAEPAAQLESDQKKSDQEAA